MVEAKCSMCGVKMSKFFGKKPLGICEPCRRVFCPNCVKGLKKEKCPSCGNKVQKERTRMKEFPDAWRVPVHGSVTQVSNPGVQVQIIEKTIIKEIVKIPCKFCGVLVENSVSVCPQCGAHV